MIQIIALIVLTAWACIQNLLYMNYLPDRVAIHFNTAGVADNWLGRGQATMMMIAIQALLPWLLVAIAQSIRFVPVSLVNIPHREYWLAPERRQATLAYVATLVSSIAVIESVFISVVNHLSFTANRTGQPLNTPLFLVALVIFLLATLVMVVKMVRRFALPKSTLPQMG